MGLIGRLFGRQTASVDVQAVANLAAKQAYARGYEAAKITGANAKFRARAKRETSGQLYAREGQVMQRLCRDIVLNSSMAMRCRNFLTDTIVGHKAPTPEINRKRIKSDRLISTIETAWADYARQTDFLGRCRVIFRERWTVGESFVVSEMLDNQPNFRVVEAEQIDNTGTLSTYKDGSITVDGIEYDAQLRPIAYHVKEALPGSWGYQSSMLSTVTPYKAKNVLHLFERTRPTAFRGMSDLATVIGEFQLIHDIDLAELASKQKEAYLGFYIKTEEDPQSVLQALGTPSTTDANGETTYLEQIDLDQNGISAGNFEIKQISPERPGAPYQAFEKILAQRSTMALCVPYSAATGDTSQSNYSTERAIAMHCKRGWLVMQRGMERLYNWEFREWLTWAILKGLINTSLSRVDEICAAVTWQHVGFEWIDPRAEQAAIETKLKNNLASVSGIISEGGQDPDDVFAAIQADREKFQSLGMVYPSDALNASGAPQYQQFDQPQEVPGDANSNPKPEA